jgi:hypothetical protein
MAEVHHYPKLRSVESIIVPDPVHGRTLMLRDTEGIASGAVVVPASLIPVLARFDGARSAAQIAADATRATGKPVSADLVEKLAAELDDAGMLDTPRFRARKQEVVRAFAEAEVRPAAHAGGAYHDDAGELTRYIEAECLAKAAPRPKAPGSLVGLCAPHMDLWRAPAGYGHAYRALAEARAELDEVDTFVLLGTSHAPMRRPFALCEKAFATPLGALEPDRAMCAELAAASRFDLRAEEYLHKQEHSLEFQAVFLRHLLGTRADRVSHARIVPVLCGLGEAQDRRRDPSLDQAAESFLAALTEACGRRAGRVMIIAGADMAHVGPRFGDKAPLGEREREALGARDRASLDRALGMDASGFFDHVAEDLSSRRVCGLGPIYTMLRALPAESRGELLHYAQHIDPAEGSIVSHASLGFYAA